MMNVMKHLAMPSLVLLLCLSSAPAGAESCQPSIDHVQARVDAAVDRQAGNGPWQRESLNALRSHQPTPESLATAEGASSAALDQALGALNRARAANSAGHSRRCFAEIAKAQRLLGSF